MVTRTPTPTQAQHNNRIVPLNTSSAVLFLCQSLVVNELGHMNACRRSIGSSAEAYSIHSSLICQCYHLSLALQNIFHRHGSHGHIGLMQIHHGPVRAALVLEPMRKCSK